MTKDVFTNMINHSKQKQLSFDTIIQNATQPKPSSLFYNQYIQNKEFSNTRMNDIFNYNSNKDIDTRDMQPKTPYVSNKDGLDNAYENTNTYQNGSTLYIAGTLNNQDHWDDISKVPVNLPVNISFIGINSSHSIFNFNITIIKLSNKMRCPCITAVHRGSRGVPRILKWGVSTELSAANEQSPHFSLEKC